MFQIFLNFTPGLVRYDYLKLALINFHVKDQKRFLQLIFLAKTVTWQLVYKKKNTFLLQKKLFFISFRLSYFNWLKS